MNIVDSEFCIDRRITAGEIGCAESHLRIYKELVKRQDSLPVIIFEDDGCILPDFNKVIIELCSLNNFWDLVLLKHWSLYHNDQILGAETACFERHKIIDHIILIALPTSH